MENLLYERVMAQIIRKTKKWNDLGKMMERRKEDPFDLILWKISLENIGVKELLLPCYEPKGLNAIYVILAAESCLPIFNF